MTGQWHKAKAMSKCRTHRLVNLGKRCLIFVSFHFTPTRHLCSCHFFAIIHNLIVIDYNDCVIDHLFLWILSLELLSGKKNNMNI